LSGSHNQAPGFAGGIDLTGDFSQVSEGVISHLWGSWFPTHTARKKAKGWGTVLVQNQTVKDLGRDVSRMTLLEFLDRDVFD
jgi:hypothetical protein